MDKVTWIEIPLKNGGFSLIDKEDHKKVVYLDEDYPYQKRTTREWFIKKDTECIRYAVANIRIAKNKWTRIRMHRLILGITDPRIMIDHVNGNGLDNRKSNLRICSQAQNIANSRKIDKKSTSRFKGVCWCKRLGKWEVTISKNYKQTYVGIFDSEIKAAKAYNKKAREIFGRFACLNKV